MMWVYALLYGLVSLLSLWGFGGGEENLFWSRTPLVAFVVLLLGLGVAVYTKEKDRLFARNPSLKTLGLGGAIAISIPLCLLLTFGAKNPNIAPLLITPPSFLTVILFTVVVATAYELVFRGLLQPHWGLFGCAFLEALNVGFGTHKILPFLAVLLLTYLGGFLRSRFGFMTGLAFRCVWTFLLLTTLLTL